MSFLFQSFVAPLSSLLSPDLSPCLAFRHRPPVCLASGKKSQLNFTSCCSSYTWIPHFSPLSWKTKTSEKAVLEQNQNKFLHNLRKHAGKNNTSLRSFTLPHSDSCKNIQCINYLLPVSALKALNSFIVKQWGSHRVFPSLHLRCRYYSILEHLSSVCVYV